MKYEEYRKIEKGCRTYYYIDKIQGERKRR
jgi:hypothetical protein